MARRARGHRDRRAARGGAHLRRNRAAAVHSAQQPVLVHQSERADGEPAHRDLSVCQFRLRRLAPSRLGGRASDHRYRAEPEHCRPAHRIQTEIAMNDMTRVDQGIRIDIRDLNFYYGKTHALKGVSVPLFDRKVTAFIGPSGCGKSTLLRVLNRIYELYPNQYAKGEVLLDGENILTNGQDLNLLRAKIGMVFQKPTPFPMTIYDNIAFGIKLYERLSKSEVDGRVEESLKRAGLWNEVKDKLQANGLSLSGGQQQRLCIARTVAVR